jgi:hypothetical protein
MSIPCLDLAIKSTVESILATVRADPDQHLPEIFADLTSPSHSILYGKNFLEQIKTWVMNTKIPVLLGNDLSGISLPGITVDLGGMSSAQSYMGDRGLSELEDLKPYQRVVLVPAFVPASATYSDDRTRVIVAFPETMPGSTRALFFSGMVARDARGHEYLLGVDDTTQLPKLTQNGSNAASLELLDYSTLEIISPYSDQVLTKGAMLYDNSVTITCHAQTNRNDAVWLWQIVFWGLLKFRPVMQQLFNIHLAFSSAGGTIREDSFQNDQVYRRDITVSCKTMLTWTHAREVDILGFVLNLNKAQAEDK